MSAWIRSAVNKAVEVGGSNNLTRTVRNYADSVVQHAGNAVAEGAKLLQDRIGARNLKSFKHAVKMLEEVSVSCRGVERVNLLRMWLAALKEIERLSMGSVQVERKNSEKPYSSGDLTDSELNMVLYYDPEIGGEPINFRNVFLYSQALEGMTFCMILEPPSEEEVSLLLEIFRLCLIGGKEVHEVTVRSIQELAKAFSRYDNEVLTKREELLQYAQGAIAGLKVNAAVERIDSEISHVHQTLDRMPHQQPSIEGNEQLPEETLAISEILEEPIAHIQLCSRLEALLLKKKFTNNGDSLEVHSQKVDKLKILSESLGSSASKNENRISDHRFQREEALNFRAAKNREIIQLEKELEAETVVLEKKRKELEAELGKVNGLLAAANVRLRNAREEREQFDEASRQILEHFTAKEDELSKSIASYTAEADACNAFVGFLEATWVFQSAHVEQKEKQVNEKLEKHEDYFAGVALHLLSSYKDELEPSVARVRKIVEILNGTERVSATDDEKLQEINPRKALEQEYVDIEIKLMSLFGTLESIKDQFYSEKGVPRKSIETINELFASIEKMKGEFKSTERPALALVTPNKKADTSLRQKPQKNLYPSFKLSSSDEELSKFGLKLDTHTRGNSIGEWEFEL